MFLFGMSFVSTATILPVYVSHLTTSAVLIGLVSSLESLGYYLPQLFIAPFVEGLARVKPLLLAVSLGERFSLLIIGLVIVAFPPTASGISNVPLILFFFILAVRMFASGASAIPWQEMIARIIATRQLGRFFAAQRFFGGIAGLLGAAVAAETLNHYDYPLNYGLCFVFAFAAAMVSWVFLSQTIEPRQKPIARQDRLATFWRELPVVLRQDHNFAMYLVARGLGYLGSMATAFFAVHAVQAFSLGDEQAAIFTAVLLGSNIIASAAWGWMGDRWGQKLVLTASSLFYALALTLAWLSDNLAAYYFVFLLVGLANAGLIISDLTLVLEFAPAARRPTYMGIARGLLGPWIGLAPIIGGILFARLGYAALLTTGWVLTCVGLVMVTALVKEPRLRQA
jgi:MFS family permease